MYTTVYLNIGEIPLLPVLLTALAAPPTRLSLPFTSFLIPLLRVFFPLHYCVRCLRKKPALCCHSLGLSWNREGVK